MAVRTVDIMLGRSLHVGRRPLLPVYLRLNGMWLQSLGYQEEDFEGVPEGQAVKPSGKDDGRLFNGVCLTMLAIALPDLFPDAQGIRDDDVLKIADVVQDGLLRMELDLKEIGEAIQTGGKLFKDLADEFAELQAKRKGVRGNSEAPKGGSSTGPT